MKTLASARDRQEILERLRVISPASKRRWGRMTVAEMICHMNDALRITMSDTPAGPVSNWFTRSGFKWLALWMPFHWPHGVKTVPECEAGKGGTLPAGMESDLTELRRQLERFARQPRDFEFQPHPIFGQMSEWEWMRWGWLHMDHHLRQFGA
jgi:hypothetical protein